MNSRPHTGTSLPVWEEWIEIARSQTKALLFLSLPVWEEWIEILHPDQAAVRRGLSLPVWEEWIEMSSPRYLPSMASGLFP